jgi:valyl-tRNA synthetase
VKRAAVLRPPDLIDSSARELAKTYDPADVEPRLIARDLDSGVFHAQPDSSRPPFIISMPPPNITGALHLGHGSTYTPMDVLTRYHRMRGDNANWLPGQDHAAIATEAVLVRELAKEGLTRDGLGRDAFLARAWQWRNQYGNRINEQFKRLGFGADWERERFTMDPGLSAAVVKAFVACYREGLIYRGTRLVNWDPKAQSTLSDAEVENEPHQGSLWHLRYRAEGGGPGVEIATTRPETFLADVAVAVHPDDERYRALIGKRVVLPLVNRAIPVIADAAVERDFGTGAVKITPAHDATDYDIAQRYNATVADPAQRLPMPTVIDYDGTMCAPAWRDPASAPASDAERAVWDAALPGVAPYAGMDRFVARKAIVADLAAADALVRVEPYATTVPVSSRSGEIIEPLLSLQWFMRMTSLAQPALHAYRDGRIRFVPERFGRTYEHGLENLRDWNISRQVWWGHQLPVWYAPDGTAIVAEDEEAARREAQTTYGTTELRRDPDTLDTWFSSGLWPFSILGWPERTPEFAAWYPNQVMITGREIIFLWVSRMVMLGLHFAGNIPFSTVFITPLVFDLQGRKMSKSLGNAIDPIDLIAKYGADGFRFGILRQMRLESQELRFDEEKCDEARRFNNKLWNALRLLRSFGEGPAPIALPPTDDLTLADRWILAKLRRTVDAVTAAYDGFEMGVAADALIGFGWMTFCDWYCEAAKAPAQRATRSAVGAYVFDVFARLMHPIAPFITEEIYGVQRPDATIVSAPWPSAADIPHDEQAEVDFDRFMTAIERLRNARAELGLAPRERVTVSGPALDEPIVEQLRIFAGADFASDGRQAATFAERIDALRLQADPAILRDRYNRDIARLTSEVERSEKKLANERFVQNAKPEVIAAERDKLAGYVRQLAEARGGLAALGS